MKPTFLFLLFIIFVFAANAQSWQWGRTISDAYEGVPQIVTDASGNVYIATEGYLRAISKYDFNGNLIYQKVFDGVGINFPSITADSKGNLIVSFSFYGGTCPPFDPFWVQIDSFYYSSPTCYDGFVLKFDELGNILWVKVPIPNNHFGAIAVDKQDNVYLSGFADTITLDNVTLSSSAQFGYVDYLAKFTEQGTLLWAKSLIDSRSSGTVARAAVSSFSIDDNDEIVFAGGFKDTVSFLGSQLTATDSSNTFLAKVDTAGNLIWIKTVTRGTGLTNRLHITGIDNNHNIYVRGFFSDTLRVDNILLSSATYTNFWTKYDAAGSLKWAHKYHSVPYTFENTHYTSSNGDCYLSGYAQDPDTPLVVNNIAYTPTNLVSTFIVKLDSNFNTKWVYEERQMAYAFFSTDHLENLYVTGSFLHTIIFGPDTLDHQGGGIISHFIAKYGNATASISGTLLTETGSPIRGATVTLTGDDYQTGITDIAGRYSFAVTEGSNYTITPSKSNDNIANNGVTLIDALLMRRHILGIPLNSPYKIIAAAEVNADSDTTITTQDILFARSLILGNITSFPTNRLWQFVSSDFIFPDTQHPFPFPATRTYTNITTNQTNQNFIGIKLGDVNGSWDANTP